MLYTFQEIRFLLLILLCIPLLLFVPLIFQRGKTEVKISEIPDYVTREEIIRLRVAVTYEGLLPLAGLKVRGSWQVHGAKRLSVESRIRGLGGHLVLVVPCRCGVHVVYCLVEPVVVATA